MRVLHSASNSCCQLNILNILSNFCNWTPFKVIIISDHLTTSPLPLPSSSEWGRKRRKPVVGRGGAILCPIAGAGRQSRWAYRRAGSARGPSYSPWRDLSGWEWANGAFNHHHCSGGCHSNLISRKWALTTKFFLILCLKKSFKRAVPLCSKVKYITQTFRKGSGPISQRCHHRTNTMFDQTLIMGLLPSFPRV